MKPLIIAHRGDTINFEENTIDAFKSALEYGADGFEFDTQLNAQGEIIVVHNFGFEQSKTYPLLSDVLKQFSDKGRLEIEIKSPHKEGVKKITNLVKVYNLTDYELVSSFIPHLPLVKNELPESNIGLIFKTTQIEEWMTEDYKLKMLLGYLELSKANILHLPIGFYNQEIVDYFHSKNYRLHAHLGDDYKKYSDAVELGIDQCSLDDVTKIKEIKNL